MSKGPTLTQEHKDRLLALARLGNLVTATDAARVVGAPDSAVRAWIRSPKGRRAWEKAQAEGRAELLLVIRRQALQGDTTAQKLLASLVAPTEVAEIAEILLPAAEVRGLLCRSKQRISQRIRAGEMVRVTRGRQYRLGDLLGLIPKLWDIIAGLRLENHNLKESLDPTRVQESEARRMVWAENARRRRRENDIAEGKLVPIEDVHDQMIRACQTIREQSANMIEHIKLRLAVDGRTAAMLDDARRTFLRRCATALAPDSPENDA